MSLERHYDVSFVAQLAMREKQIQQNYRPVIAVHKWFARRPGTLFRGLMLAEFGEGSIRENFYGNNDLSGLRIADPFMGGGTPLMEANRLGCDVVGYDINPMSYWVVKQEIEHVDLASYRSAARDLITGLREEIGSLYQTQCVKCEQTAEAKYFLWVCEQNCAACGHTIDLFPGYLVAEDVRHPMNVLVCSKCGDLNECESCETPGNCSSCREPLVVKGPASRNRCACPSCGVIAKYPASADGPPRYRMFAIEYHCSGCKNGLVGRLFKRPDARDEANYAAAAARFRKLRPKFVPNDDIPSGDETNRLHRWGYHKYRQTFNERQLLGLELSCRSVSSVKDQRVRNALATNLSDLLRYQNMLCRYDTMALKSLDIFSVHGFPVGLVRCESNLLGITSGGTNVGSGGWSNITDKYARAKEYCERPFEVLQENGKKRRVYTPNEWIGDSRNDGDTYSKRTVTLRCASATEAQLSPASLDGVFTDPPYFGSVQYAELMDYCYVWLRQLVGEQEQCFTSPSTRHGDELTGNDTMSRGLVHFADGLSAVFRRMASAMKHRAPFVFTYHHNSIDAYLPVGVAILDAGFACTASLPCPAEMGASIHISGTGSSVVDTVFVCRTTGIMRRDWTAKNVEDVARLVEADLAQLRAAGLKPSAGDTRCIIHGQLLRLGIWKVRQAWNVDAATSEKFDCLAKAMNDFGSVETVRERLSDRQPLGGAGVVGGAVTQADFFRESAAPYRSEIDEIPF